jgi:hypothetical protein
MIPVLSKTQVYGIMLNGFFPSKMYYNLFSDIEVIQIVAK